MQLISTASAAFAPLALDTLGRVHLSTGHHERPDEGLCVMECVAFVAGEPHTDRPACACPVITQLAIHANDALGFLAQHGKELAQRVIALAGSKGSAATAHARACFLFNSAMQLLASGYLKGTRPKVARMLMALPAITGRDQLPDLNAVLAYAETHDRDEYLRLKLTEPLRSAIHGLETSNSLTVCLAALQIINQPGLHPNLMGLLDSLLAIDTAPAVVTPAMKTRIALLATESDMATA